MTQGSSPGHALPRTAKTWSLPRLAVRPSQSKVLPASGGLVNDKGRGRKQKKQEENKEEQKLGKALRWSGGRKLHYDSSIHRLASPMYTFGYKLEWTWWVGCRWLQG